VSHGRDRDAAVDRWLRRTTAQGAPLSGTGPCPDAEELAAWADGGVSAQARSIIEGHLSGCPRCQAIAGTMARTESIAEWSVPERRSPWRWLSWAIPLTGAATIAMLVVLDRQMRVMPNQAPAAAPPMVAMERKADQPGARSGERSALNDQAAAAAPRERQAAERADEQRRTGSPAKAENERKSIDTLAAAPRPSSPPAPVASPPAAVTEPTLGRAQKQAAANPARAEESDRAALGRFAQAPMEIRSTDTNVRWRVAGSQVQRSIDAGSTWTPVDLGVTAAITAGAAPTSTVCWLVGRGGVVLLTTDGKTWTRTTTPDATDLSAVRASDARNATVTTADGREFTTTDGGRTWLRRDLQENPTAPF
jgi:hypothetical protein